MAISGTTVNMTKGPLFKEVLLYSFPLILSGLLQLCFNAADMIVVGRFASANSLGAVGATGSFCNLIITIFLGLSVGANVLVANRFGAHDLRGVSRAAHTSIVVALCGGLVLAAIGVVISEPVLRLIAVPGDVIDLSSLYMKYFCIGIPFNLLYNFGSAILRAVGDTKRPLYYLTVAGAVNVALNLLFVIFCKMDVAGVALATVASQAISSFLVIRALAVSHGICRLRARLLRVDFGMLKDLARIGLPAGFQSSMFSIANMIIQSGVNSFGALPLAGNTAAGNIEGFIYVATNSYYQAVTTIVGQNYGAHKFARIVKSFFYCNFLAVMLNFILGAVVIIFAKELIGFYNPDPTVVEYGVQRLETIAISYTLCSIMDIITGALRGTGHSLYPAVVTLIGACGLRVIWVIFVFPLCPTLPFLLLCFPMSWIVVSLVNGSHLWHVLSELKSSHMRQGVD